VRRALAATLLLLSLASCGRGGWDRAACTPAKPHDPGESTLELGDRRAELFVPEAYDGTEAYPLVFSWHGYGSTATDHLKYADFRPLAEKEHFLVVAPQGAGTPTRFNLGAGIVGDTDDVRFATDLLDRIGADLCLDTGRVYSTGVSNGGGMSGLLACRLPDRFAAVGMDALLLHPDGCGTPTPAVLGMMGDADLVVPFQGGRVNCCGGWDIAPAGVTMQAWADQAHCTDHHDDGVSDHIDRRTWTGCDGHVEVQYYVVHDGGHTWPGAADTSSLGNTNREIDASKVIWDFFKRYSR
jgi:polyhydroxybutyrate depolymerase